MLWDYFSCFIFICYKWALGDLVRVMWPCAHKFVLVGWRNSRVMKGVGAHKSNEESVNYSDSSKTSTKDRLIRPFHSYSPPPKPCLSCSWNTGGGSYYEVKYFPKIFSCFEIIQSQNPKKETGRGVVRVKGDNVDLGALHVAHCELRFNYVWYPSGDLYGWNNSNLLADESP